MKKQFEALEHFHRLLTMAATLSLPKKYESAPDDPEHADIIRQHRDFAADVERARRRLLLAGCDVPNAWLTVKLQGQLRQSSKRGGDGGWRLTTLVEVADKAAVEAVRDDVGAVLLRLRMSAEGAPQPHGDKTGNASKSAGQTAKKAIRPPSERQRQLAAAYEQLAGKTQQEVADVVNGLLNKQGKPGNITQVAISKAVKAENAYRRKMGLPLIPKRGKKAASVNPAAIEMGQRTDGRTSRQRSRFDE